MNSLQIDQLHNLCKTIGWIKSQLMEEMPHFGHMGLFLQNDEITTGQLNNKTEIKIHLLSGKLLYFHNEEGHFVDLEKDDIYENLQEITQKYNLKLPSMKLERIDLEQRCSFQEYGMKVNRSLELFRMKLTGRFSLVHLWPEHFDFSVEWFTGEKNEQIGVGISPGDEKYKFPYLYVNPYPFNQRLTQQKLIVGTWHTSGWNGIKLDWKDLEEYPEQKIAEIINKLFSVAKTNFE